MIPVSYIHSLARLIIGSIDNVSCLIDYAQAENIWNDCGLFLEKFHKRAIVLSGDSIYPCPLICYRTQGKVNLFDQGDQVLFQDFREVGNVILRARFVLDPALPQSPT